MATRIDIPINPSSTPVFGSKSFSPKLINIAIGLGGGAAGVQPISFASTGSGQVNISGARTSVRVSNAGGAVGATADIAVWGLAQSLMNELDTLGLDATKIARNILTITAGDAVSGMATVFTGNIVQAFADYNAAPDVSIRMNCKAGVLEAALPLQPTTFNGSVSVVTLFSTIANGVGWGFFNNGVDPSLSLTNPYFSGSAVDQYKKLKDAVRVNATLLPGNVLGQSNVLFIWPRGGAPPAGGSGIPVVSPQTGMIGYPTYANGGIFVRMLYNPQIAPGTQIQVQSSLFTNQSLTTLAAANSLWTVYRIDHALDSLVPKGQWSTTVWAAGVNPFTPTLPPP